MRWKSLLFLLLLSASLQAQQECSFVVEGTVRDITTQEPLPFASVSIDGTTRGASTDENGFFRISNICDDEFDLIFSFVGYKQLVHHHDVHHKLPNIYLASAEKLLNSVVVEGEALNAFVESMPAETLEGRELDALNNGSLAELTANFTGVSMISTGQNVAKPMIHGLHSNRVVIINNGVRHEFQNWGQDHAPEIDPDLAEKVTVVKGASTVRYGSEALGGVILLDGPSMELHEDLKGSASTGFQLNGRRVDGNLELRQGGERISWMVQGGVLMQGDRRAPDYNLTNTGKQERTLAGGIRYHNPNMDIRVLYTSFKQELGILRASVTGSLEDLNNAIESDVPLIVDPFSYDINTPRQQVDHDMLKVNFQLHNKRKTSLLDMTYAFQKNHRQEFDVRRGTLNDLPSIDLDLLTHSMDLHWDHPEFGPLQGSVGVQGSYQDNNNIPGTNTVPFIPNYNNYKFGLYMIESISSGDVTYEAGIRYDYLYSSIRGRKQDNSLFSNELSFQNVSATLGIHWVVSPKVQIRSNFGTAFRPPNIFELYVFGKHGANIEYGMLRYQREEDGSINTDVLLSEEDKIIPAEKGLKWVSTLIFTNKKVQTEVTAYVNYIRNFIYSYPEGVTNTVRGAFPYFLYTQSDALLTGIDFSANMQHTDTWSSTAKLSFLYARDLVADDFFVEMPPLRIDYDLAFTPDWGDRHSIQFRLKTAYLFRQFMAPDVIPVSDFLEAPYPETDGRNFDFVNTPDGVLLMGIGVFGETGRFDYSLEAENLLNQSYRLNTDSFRYFADQAGINIIARIKYSF